MLALVLLACSRGPGLFSDGDGDGALAAVDCDDGDARRHPGAREIPTDGIDQDCNGVDALAAGARVGGSVDEGFGFAVTTDGERAIVGAPFYAEGGRAMGRVWIEGEVVATGAPGDRAGASLVVLDSGEVLVAAPGAGEVRTLSGEVRAAGLGVGAALAARGDRWVTSARDGARRDDGSLVPWGALPASLAIGANGEIAGGFPRSGDAVRIDADTVTGPPGAEVGYALLYADLGGEPGEELVIGAPGEGAVYVLPAGASTLAAAARWVGEAGRFGSSLAVADGALFVGAPLDTGGRGAVWRIPSGGPPERWIEGEDGEQLGAALFAAEGALLVGAPGALGRPGAVRIVPF